MAAAVIPQRLAGRYEIRQVLGQGGMGLVYRAFDTVVRREVAVKTLRDIPEQAALQLFYKECDVLASMSHPNIVEIFDVGEFEEEGQRKPYFVMPLLPGRTLDNLIRNASHRLTVERTVEIITQTCRGLQVAHEHGLVHRDLKPSNIFVMEDDSVKIIDFGVAHMTNALTTMGQKGTLLYMSPEQIEMKPLSALSDIFSLSVLCYEALTGRHPFRRTREEEIVDAVLHQVPPPASEINPAVNQSISRVVHKGMAKQPWHRFSTAREFGETLNKALRNEPIELFDHARIRPRLERVTRALEEGDYQFAGEILGELESEGHLDSSIDALRQQLDRSVRQKTIAQLLDSAKARFEEEEDPLALQKLQEVLQLEPDNGPALALKSKIENRRSERQIENWYRLARQHMDNHAYSHARGALQNVLQLRPKEARAVQLLSDVDQQEQEYNKLRQEKASLHRAAVEAWQKGEVSTALTKLALVLELDRQAPDSSDPERSAAYQNLYNQVRSEHDALNTAYAEARKHLADRNFAKAIALCDSCLAKYPGHALFQALKFDIEEQQRQELSAYIASVDRQVESELDLDKRVNILKDALELQPRESHFEKALRLVQDKRDLVNSIVARAHLHEEQGLFVEALGDWEILRNIYGQYPGLKFEIERLQKRHEQQTRAEAKSRWVEKIDSSLHSSDYARALEFLQKAKAEFPEDAELSQLEKRARDGMARATEAQELMRRGQELCAEHQFGEGISVLRQAYQLDEHNPIARAVLADALVEQARLVLDRDWKASEALVQQALDLIPLHSLAKSVRTLVLDRKREEFVNECIAQGRRMQAAGDLAGAQGRVAQGLSVYATEPRLLQLRDTLEREREQSRRREDRRRDLEELRHIDRESERVSDLEITRNLAERAKALAAKHADDEELSTVAREVQQRLARPLTPEPSSTTGRLPAPQAESATRLFSASPEIAPSGGPQPLPRAPTARGTTPAVVPQKATGPARKAPPRPGQPRAAALAPLTEAISKSAAAAMPLLTGLKNRVRRISPKAVTVVAAGSVLVVALVFVVSRVIHRQRPSAATAAAVLVRVSIHTTPPGASIRVDSQDRGVSDLELSLLPGAHQVEASLAGYQNATTAIQTGAGAPTSFDLTLQPAVPVLRVFTDSGTGKVWYDDKAAGELESAAWSLDHVMPGTHTVKVSVPNGSASFAFTVTAGLPPALSQPISVSGIQAVVVGNFGNSVRVYCSFCPAQMSVDGQPRMEVGNDGAELSGLSLGTHKLVLTRGNDTHTLDVDTGPAPTVNAFLVSKQNIGTLLVITGEDKVRVFLDGRLYRHETAGGQLRIPELEPKEYTVRVAKDGFQDAPEQRVRINKGEQARLIFSLQPLAQQAILSIQNGTPGSDVLVDQHLVGTIQRDGSLYVATISPGDHTLEIRKEHYKTVRLQKKFATGAPVSLAGGTASLQALTGELRITFSPADAVVTLGKPGETATKVTSGSTLNLPPGTYNLVARTSENVTRSSRVRVVAGESRSFHLPLTPSGMSAWDVPGGWRSEKGWYMRQGGGFALYRPSPVSGTFSFSVSLLKGKRVQWVINYLDDKNYELFQIDDNYFYRSQMRDGKMSETAKVPIKSEKKKFHTLQVQISSNQIVHWILRGEKWELLDTVAAQGRSFSAGKFGLYIPGNDEVALTNFAYYADLMLH